MEAHNCKHADVHVPYGIVMRRCHQLLGALLLPVRSVYKEQIVLPQSLLFHRLATRTCVWVYICLFLRLCFSDEKSQQTEFTHAHYSSTVAQRRNTGRLFVIHENISKCFSSPSSLYRSLKKRKKTVRDLYFEKLLKDDCCVCHLWLNYSADQVSIVIGQFCWTTNMIGQFQWNNRPLKLTGSNETGTKFYIWSHNSVSVCAQLDIFIYLHFIKRKSNYICGLLKLSYLNTNISRRNKFI